MERLAREEFSVVISDLQMPGVSGLELLEGVRKEYPRVAFLMATGVDDIRVGIQAMRQGAADYLLKPLHVDAVVVSVERALERKRLEIEVEKYRQHLEYMVQQRTHQLEAAMERVATAKRHIELTYDETLEALAAALDLRDNETAGHSHRVTRYSLAIAEKMNLLAEQMKEIARGAYLHDIGKIGIPDAILLKPGKLTPEEREVIETHARIGYDLVSRIAFLAPAAEIVLTHQERYDGTGYPQGLPDQQIPLGSRIFAIADTLDAMTSDRPYRKALPFAAARAEIIRESSRQFDPTVVQVFLSIPEQVWKEIRLEVAASRKNERRLPPVEVHDPVKIGN
jgi:putative nucleotidyltransferase with HDIG domain